MALLTVDNVEVKYLNVILVLRGVSVELPESGLVAVLGNNGAGKTTTLKAISGLLKTEEGKVTAGTIRYDGRYIHNDDPENIARRGIIQVLEGRKILERLSVEENLKAGSYVHASDRKNLNRDLDMVYNYFPKLRTLQKQTSGYLSGGEGQMLVVGRALMAHPRIMLLDEASLGLAPLLMQEIFTIIKRINAEERMSILLVEQNARAALSIANYGYVIESGRIVLEGPASTLINNDDIKEFYLGLGESGETKSYRNTKHYKRRKRWLG